MKTVRELNQYIQKNFKISLDCKQVMSQAGKKEVSLFDQKQDQLSTMLDIIHGNAIQLKSKVTYKDVGTVMQVGNGVARVSGLPSIGIGELVQFPSGLQGMVLNLGHNSIDVILLGSDEDILGGDLVMATGKALTVPVGPDLQGRLVNALGVPLDNEPAIRPVDLYPLENDAPGIISRTKVNTPLHTGIKIIDTLIPIGRGQRELILGDRKSGKTSIAIDTILSQKGQNVDCIYVSIGQKKSTTLELIETLRARDAMYYTTVVAAGPDDPPALRYLAPFCGCSIAEYQAHELGHDVLVVFDDLSKHANAYRELSLLLRRPPGREAYPGDIFYLHARLLERACKMSAEFGGGSITALPIAEIQRGNVSSYIPTNLISITDGQIILDTNQFNAGNRPAIDIGRSVSRVGGAAQSPAMRKVAGNLRLELSQYEEVIQFTRFKAETDETTRQQIEKGQRVMQALRQGVHVPMPQTDQIVLLYAVLHQYFDDVPIADFDSKEKELLSFMHREHADLLRTLGQEKVLSPDLEEALRTSLALLIERRNPEIVEAS